MFCLVGDCGKIVILAIFGKFVVFANVYWGPILLCALPRYRLWQNCHFCHICQICRFRQLLCGPYTSLCFSSLAIVAKLSCSPYLPNSPLRQRLLGPYTALCFNSFAIVAKLSVLPYLQNSPLLPTCVGPLYRFVFCLVGDCGKIVIFAYLPNSPLSPTSIGPLDCFVFRMIWRLCQNCHLRHICQIRRFGQLLWGPYTALCFASLAIVAKLSFLPYLQNSPLSPTFMGPPSLLCALPRWRLWQNCHFCDICQIRRFRQLLWGPFTSLCLALLAIVAKLSFWPYLLNLPLSPTFKGPLYRFVLCLER